MRPREARNGSGRAGQGADPPRIESELGASRGTIRGGSASMSGYDRKRHWNRKGLAVTKWNTSLGHYATMRDGSATFNS
jgi:hypothetical protein